MAKAIHHNSAKESDSPFIGINCAAIPENLMEAELFGYEKGAYTGAAAGAKGLFEMAGSGTLFLDEIGEIPPHLQSKLLGVLDDHRIKRLGGQHFKPVGARVLAATNVDLAEAVRERRFRQDLFYRLSVMHIHVPPLRERLADLTDLCRHFMRQIAPDRNIVLEDGQIAAMQSYGWPGNVRELRNIIERAILVRSGPGIVPARLLGRTAPISATGRGFIFRKRHRSAERNGTSLYPKGAGQLSEQSYPNGQGFGHIPLYPDAETRRVRTSQPQRQPLTADQVAATRCVFLKTVFSATGYKRPVAFFTCRLALNGDFNALAPDFLPV